MLEPLSAYETLPYSTGNIMSLHPCGGICDYGIRLRVVETKAWSSQGLCSGSGTLWSIWSSPVDVGSSPSSTNEQINQIWDHVHLTTQPLKKSEQNSFHLNLAPSLGHPWRGLKDQECWAHAVTSWPCHGCCVLLLNVLLLLSPFSLLERWDRVTTTTRRPGVTRAPAKPAGNTAVLRRAQKTDYVELVVGWCPNEWRMI